MSSIKTTFGWGGKNLNPTGAADDPTLAEALRDIADDLERLKNPGEGSLRSGGVVLADWPLLDDPTTGSSQLTGTGNTTWNVNVAAFQCTVGGVAKEFAAAADFSIHSGSFLAGLVNGASCIAAIIAQNDGGTVTCVAVKGTPDTTGSEVAPTDDEIQAAIGSTLPWIKVGECTLTRDGDTSVTETQDMSKVELSSGRDDYTLLTTKSAE
jgi:hypothetical protein